MRPWIVFFNAFLIGDSWGHLHAGKFEWAYVALISMGILALILEYSWAKDNEKT